MNARRGLTLVEVLLVVVIVGLLIWLVILPLRGRAIKARRIRCSNNLNQLAKGIVTYIGELGGNRFLPCPLGLGRKANDYDGAEWLATLYWNGQTHDPGIFLCPSSGDTNRNGKDLATFPDPGRDWDGRIAPTFGSDTVSYAGLHYHSLTDTDGKPMPFAIRDDFPPDEPMASDDTQGTINHGESGYRGMNVLFFDHHVEFKTDAELDPETAVGATARPGQPKPLLWRLRN